MKVLYFLISVVLFFSACGQPVEKNYQLKERQDIAFNIIPSGSKRFSFCLKTHELHFLNATWAAVLTHLTEVKAEKSNPWYQKFGFTNVIHINEEQTGTQADWLENDQMVALVFRGTDEPKDILYDLNLRKEEVPGVGSFHQGFADAFKSTWPRLLPLLERASNKPLWVLGHSLGGALTQVYYAYHVASEKSGVKLPEIYGLFNFGTPAPLAPETEKNLTQTIIQKNIPFFHIRNPHDIVAYVVPYYLNLGKPFALLENKSILLTNEAHNIKNYFNALQHLATGTPQGCDGDTFNGPLF